MDRQIKMNEATESSLGWLTAIFGWFGGIFTLSTIAAFLGVVLTLTLIIRNIMYICHNWTNQEWCSGRKKE